MFYACKTKGIARLAKSCFKQCRHSPANALKLQLLKLAIIHKNTKQVCYFAVPRRALCKWHRHARLPKFQKLAFAILLGKFFHAKMLKF